MFKGDEFVSEYCGTFIEDADKTWHDRFKANKQGPEAREQKHKPLKRDVNSSAGAVGVEDEESDTHWNSSANGASMIGNPSLPTPIPLS